MSPVPERYNSTIDEAVAHLISRAADKRGHDAADLRPRVVSALEKYLLKDNGNAEHSEIKTFIDELRADDLCLIIACEKGDEKAWEDLVANFDSAVKSAARKISANNEDADDLAGSIWAELYGIRQDADGNKKSKLAYYSGRGSLAGWLRAVVSQLAIDQFRKQSKFVQIEEDREFENLTSENSHNPTIAHNSDSPEEMFAEQEAARDVTEALKEAVAKLEPEDRLITKMYYFNELKLKDIANTFGYHEATASRKLVRIHAVIRKSVEKGLRERHGWSENEVKRYLSETASKLGISIETMFAVLLAAAFLQDFFAGGVL